MTDTLFEVADARKPWQRSTLEGGLPYRHTDPETSKAAAKRAGGKAGTLRALVLDTLRTPEGMTHDELITALPGWSQSGIRTRCHELVEAGLVIAIGERTSAAGNRSKVWRAR